MMATKDPLWLGRKPLRILCCKDVEVRGNTFIGEDIGSEPVEIIESEDVKLRKQ